MKQFLKFMGIIAVSISFLGLTAGCGKKLVRGSAGSEKQIMRASLKPAALSQLSKPASRSVDLTQPQVSQEFDLHAGKNGGSNESGSKGPHIQGGKGSAVSNHASERSKRLNTKAMLTTPASSPRFDTPFSSNRLPAAESFKRTGDQSGMASGQHPQQTQDKDQLSRGDTQRKGVTFSNGLKDIYFEFDSWRLSEESRRILEANAEWLKARPHERITIEGHCDERGTQAYNYVLGEKRATMVQQYLGFLGVSRHQLIVTSFGKDRPTCHSFSEACFQENRRAHFGSDLNIAAQ